MRDRCETIRPWKQSLLIIARGECDLQNHVGDADLLKCLSIAATLMIRTYRNRRNEWYPSALQAALEWT